MMHTHAYAFVHVYTITYHHIYMCATTTMPLVPSQPPHIVQDTIHDNIMPFSGRSYFLTPVQLSQLAGITRGYSFMVACYYEHSTSCKIPW